MSRRPTTNTAGVSLFPFLAVLVCTMGALILLLLVTTRRIRATAIERARQRAVPSSKSECPREPTPTQHPKQSGPELDFDPAAEWQTLVEQLTAERDRLQNQLRDVRQKLADAESSIGRTKVRAASAAGRLHELREQHEQFVAEQDRLQSEIAILESHLSGAEERLTKAIERQQTARSKFAFLPFDGRTGTTRRPILIECTQEHIRFLPEDVRLTPADLNGFTAGFNPLLIASRELIHYWKAHDRVHDPAATLAADSDAIETDLAALRDNQHEPYVLLLVRPDGAVAFHIAKSLLAQLKVPHGYELITDDMEIDASQPDPDARRVCQAAVTQVLAERDKLVQALARNREPQRDQLLLEPTARTFVPKDSVGSAPRTARSRAASTPSPDANIGGSAVRGSAQPKAITSESPLRAPANLNEPPEEPLPHAKLSARADDDTKPFPFRGDRAARTESTSNQAASSRSKAQSPTARSQPDARSKSNAPNSPTNAPGNSPHLARAKRRYLMPRSGIGLEKAILIRIWASRIVVAGEYEIPVEPGVRTESLIDRVLLAMDRVQTGWPSAGEGYHWVPTIKYEVVPGGEQVHQRLNSGLFDLGLVSSVEFLDTDPEATTQPPTPRETSRSRAAQGGVR